MSGTDIKRERERKAEKEGRTYNEATFFIHELLLKMEIFWNAI